MTDQLETIAINGKAHLTINGVLKMAEAHGLDATGVKKRLARAKKITMAWLQLSCAIDLSSKHIANEALRDLFFALGAASCEELDDGQLRFTGIGRKPGRVLFVKIGLEEIP